MNKGMVHCQCSISKLAYLLNASQDSNRSVGQGSRRRTNQLNLNLQKKKKCYKTRASMAKKLFLKMLLYLPKLMLCSDPTRDRDTHACL